MKDGCAAWPVRPARVVFGSSLTDNSPLKALVARNVTPELIDRIAGEHAKGRRRLVGTTNLDAQRPIVWDMTLIAASGNPNRVQLFREVLIASATIPGIFPPQAEKTETKALAGAPWDILPSM